MQVHNYINDRPAGTWKHSSIRSPPHRTESQKALISSFPKRPLPLFEETAQRTLLDFFSIFLSQQFSSKSVHNFFSLNSLTLVKYIFETASPIWCSGQTVCRVLKCTSSRTPSSLHWNTFATDEKEILQSTKTAVTELLINIVCQLTLSNHNNILNHR